MENTPLISVCIMTLGRETLYQTIKSVLSQEVDTPYELVIVLQGAIDMDRLKSLNTHNIPLSVHTYPHNLGFGYYRNRCIDHSNGDILVWIDDDEWTMNDEWLDNLTRPIRDGKFEVTTAGCHIPLGQGYLTDCISLLGWPGGGALGFEKMWVVKNDITMHLCSGNFAIDTSLMRRIMFSETALYGGEDNGLAATLLGKNTPISYISSATVYHTARNFHQAVSWWKLRAKSMKSGTKNKIYEESPRDKKIRFLRNLLRLDRYLVGKVFCLTCMIYFVVTQKYASK